MALKELVTYVSRTSASRPVCLYDLAENTAGTSTR